MHAMFSQDSCVYGIRFIREPVYDLNTRRFQRGEIQVLVSDNKDFAKTRATFEICGGGINRHDENSMLIYANQDEINALHRLADKLNNRSFNSELQKIDAKLQEIQYRAEPNTPQPFNV